MIQISFSFWQELPYCLVGVGHWEEEKARRAAQLALQQWDQALLRRDRASPGKQQAGELGLHMHALTRLWLSGEHIELTEALKSFASGARSIMDPDMAILRILAGRLAVVYLIEISVEGLHALVKKTVLHARHHSGAHASFVFAAACVETYVVGTAWNVAGYLLDVLGLKPHISMPCDMSDVGWKFANQIMCRLDRKTQFRDLSSLHYT